jgi:flavin-dependent dehydrogenase
MLLARAGHRVLLVDRDTFPSETLSTSFMQEDATRRLDGWGLLERLIATGTPGATSVVAHAMGMDLPRPAGAYPAYAPRRRVLDSLLVDAAREAGVEVRESFSVQDLLFDASGAVSGVIGQSKGEQVMEDARIVIGADGRNSFVARQVGAEEYNESMPSTCGFYSYFEGGDLPMDTAEIFFGGRHFIFYFPTNDGQACMGAEAPLAVWEQFRADPGAYLLEITARLAPAVHQRLKSSRPAERYLGMTGRRSFFRKPYGPGWALVGDAGYLKDPIMGSGIDDAFRDAELLSGALIEAWSGKAQLEAALSGYQAARDESEAQRYPVICELAKLEELTPEIMMGFASVAGRPPA